MRQLDVEADGEAAALLAAAVRRLHHAGSAAGHDRPAGLREQLRRRARRLVRTAALGDARRAEERDGRPVDLLHRLEPLEELVRDQLRMASQLGERLMRLEQLPVIVHSIVPP